jgi:hypothetical protein
MVLCTGQITFERIQSKFEAGLSLGQKKQGVPASLFGGRFVF